MAAASVSPTQNERELFEEGGLLARYLLGREASGVLLQRYADGCRRLFNEPASSTTSATVGPVVGTTPATVRGEATLRFVRRHTWALPFLDAACGLLEPQAQLRKRLFLMLAILETAPEHADEFLPAAQSSRMGAVTRIGLMGLTSVAKACIGVALYPIAKRAT